MFHKLGARIGFSRTLSLLYSGWTFTLVLTYLVIIDAQSRPWLFLIIPLFGFIAGGSLSQARNVFGNLVPDGRAAEFYGLYSMAVYMFQVCMCVCVGVCVTTNSLLFHQWSGVLLFTLVNEWFNSLRRGVLFQSVLLLVSAILQFTIPNASNFKSNREENNSMEMDDIEA